MSSTRTIKRILKSKPTLEGAGVHLFRGFGFSELPEFDPFLLFDDFGSDTPDDYIKGFPWHPHRGIETITYMLDGMAEHKDSLGNSGVIKTGDVQWMTAGSGIIHQEMPQGDSNSQMHGFQLWANLPASHKMMKPRYRDINKEKIPEINPAKGVSIKIISGEYDGIKGPAKDIVIDPEYLDVRLEPELSFHHKTKPEYTVFAYVYRGSATFQPDSENQIGPKNVILFNPGDEIRVESGKNGISFLLISGKPLNEPIAWAGPIVMNTQAELQTAFEEYNNGTFLKQ